MVRNDRIIGQAVPREAPTELEEIKLTEKMVSQIEFFFKAYNKAYGQHFKVLGTGNAKRAVELVERSVKEAQKCSTFGSPQSGVSSARSPSRGAVAHVRPLSRRS